MRNLFLMSLFGLFMVVAISGQSLTHVTLVTASYASENNNDEGGNNDAANNDESSGDEAALSCPEGITTCYSADGSEYTDVNNLPATAAGSEGEDDEGEALVSVVKPSHFRSF